MWKIQESDKHQMRRFLRNKKSKDLLRDLALEMERVLGLIVLDTRDKEATIKSIAERKYIESNFIQNRDLENWFAAEKEYQQNEIDRSILIKCELENIIQMISSKYNVNQGEVHTIFRVVLTGSNDKKAPLESTLMQLGKDGAKNRITQVVNSLEEEEVVVG